MKVIAFNGSPHEQGASNRGILTVISELEKEGISSEILHIGDKNIQGCVACRSCYKTGRCKFDDIVNQSSEKLEKADGIILASPVYYGGIAGNFKCFLDRLFYSGPKLRRKAGAVIASVRRTGGIGVFHQLCNYLTLAGVIITPTVYWNVIHGNSAVEAEQDAEGLYTLRTLGRNMAWLLKTLELGGKSIPLPQEEPRIFTNFIR
ncbi:MAG: flavodoxin family protein [Spirochaetaceae bacterium]|jgi:multimeric flavodoxin WrbA|nr:flavodoxin family protein [Spirochaetaceae bacterium]